MILMAVSNLHMDFNSVYISPDIGYYMTGHLFLQDSIFYHITIAGQLSFSSA